MRKPEGFLKESRNALKAVYPLIDGGANPPIIRKEGDANVCYLSGYDPDRDILSSSHRSNNKDQ